ncbi:mechanosensitive ion channel domain-containing protein [Hyphomonas sp.]|uniref:mechanosensitive ion channel domain-containing protein n=1 Tax=Hyphomonas sp. TaxID=87 RepID=UPI00391D68BF
MTDLTDASWLLAYITLDTTGWPGWLAATWPQILKWTLVLISVALIWFIASLVKFAVQFAGRRLTPKDKEFEGSVWDFSASIARVFAFILMSPLPLGLAGFDWRTLIETRGPGAFSAVIIFVLAILIANSIAKALRRFGEKAHSRAGADDTLIAFSASLIKYIIFAVAIVLALVQLGFPAASLAAVLGAAGLAIGLALQDTLKSVAAGVMLALFRPFRIGDFVTLAGLDGEITNITPFTTSLKQIDNKIVSVTNDKVWGSPLINHTLQPYRRLDMYFSVSYDDDLDHALDVLKNAADGHPNVVSYMNIWTGVHSLDDWSVKLRLRAWTATVDFVQVRADINKAVKQAFDREGIIIPYPHAVEYQIEGKPKKLREGALYDDKPRAYEPPDDEGGD